MNKYIVKNCPCVYKSYRTEHDCDYDGPCEDCTDCLIKQVIEKCKNISCPCEDKGTPCLVCGEDSRKILADNILQLFEIEECE